MIRKLNESDRKEVLSYLKKEAEFNLFFIGDIENYGFDREFQTLWADFDHENNYKCVLLKYYENLVVYIDDSDGYNLSEITKILNSYIDQNELGVISGKLEIINKLFPLVENGKSFRKRIEYFSRCIKVNSAIPLTQLEKVRFATFNDVEEVAVLLENIEEFGGVRNIEGMKKGIEEGASKIVLIRDDKTNKVISSASTSAENSESAMIVAVATHPEHRGHGYASACVYSLIKNIIAEERTACLFYDNPKAGRIYRKLGFEEIGKWCMLDKKK